MVSLTTLQKQFIAISSSKQIANEPLYDLIQSNEIDARLPIYRNHYFYSLANNLTAIFETCLKTVGEPFFKAVCHAFIEAHPPSSPNLNQYGAGLPEFMAHFEHTQNTPYLVDCARLDWQRHTAYYEEDSASFTLTTLAAQSTAAVEQAQCIFHPSVFLLRSSYSIWQLFQSETEDETKITIDKHENIITYKENFNVSSSYLSDSQAYFINALMNQVKLVDALEQTQVTYQQFDASQAIFELSQLPILLYLQH